MKYNTIKYNDVANAPGVAVSVYLQGCPHHCYNCFNPETWDFDGGLEFTQDTLNHIVKGLTAFGVHRSLCILGGEPLCEENAFTTLLIIKTVKEKLPDTKIYIWSGYLYENLKENSNPHIQTILKMADYLIDGPYIDSLRDISLVMRGSSNQRVINLKEN